MKDQLNKYGVDVTELSKRFNLSRPTVYKYMSRYIEGELSAIPEKYRIFFEFISNKPEPTAAEVKAFLQNMFPQGSESVTIESDNALEEVISKFCDDIQIQSNFLSVVLPTGARKTTSIVNFIAKYIASGGKNNIFFITTLKKNLPINEDPAEDQLRKSFEENGIGALYEQKVMMVEALGRMLYTNYNLLTPLEQRYALQFMGPKMASELKSLLSSLSGLDESQPAFKQIFKEFREFESRFRNAIHSQLNHITKDPAEKKRIVTTDSQWSWASKIYPTVHTSERQVFLMSMDKFISNHDTIVDGRYSLYDSKLIDNAYIFIDEFDATKETILKNIIEHDQGDVDYVGIFRRIYRTLEHNRDIWMEYYRVPDTEGAVNTREQVNEIYTNAQSMAEDYHLDCDFKLADNEPQTYIFRDNRIIKTGRSQEFYIDYDENERINLIRSVVIKDESEREKIPRNRKGYKLTVSSMLGRMYSLFRHFESVMNTVAMNHYNIVDAAGKPITRDAAIRTVLNPYDFNEKQVEYLVNAIKFRPMMLKRDSLEAPDVSFYEMGFEFFNFVDNDDHNLATKIYCTSIKRTPEKMLMITLDHKHDAKMVGISATARLRSVIGNYDFRFLRAQRDFKEYVIDQADRIRLKDMFAKTIDHYDRVDIIPKRITGKVPVKDLIVEKKAAVDTMSYLETFNSQPFVKARYLRILEVYHDFLVNEDIRSMLCFMNLFPKEKGSNNNEEFKIEFLKNVFSAMVKDHIDILKKGGMAEPEYLKLLIEEPFIIMRSDSFDKNKDNLLKRLAKGEKIFVMTTYSTIGAGQNLQYKVPANVLQNIRYVSSLANPEKYNYKDFDAIYFDMPTNVRPQVKEYEKGSLLSALFAIESLQESHEIDKRGAKDEISNVFAEFFGNPPSKSRKPILEHYSYRMAYARRIIQAVGRICRTFAKNRNIYVFADDNLGAIFKGTSLKDFTDPNDPGKDLEERMVNPEFKKLLAELQNSDYSSDTSDEKMEDNESVKAAAYIDSILKNNVWTKNSMRSWNGIREFVMRFPTVSADSKLSLVYNMYSKIEKGNRLRYDQENDHREIYLDENGAYEVSQEDARLNDLMKIPCVRSMFGEPAKLDFTRMPTDEELMRLPYANSFSENTSIMCPVLYHNIYKGALGEKCGKAILESWNIDINEIDDPKKFEKFDFVAGNEIYLDFKYWAGPGAIDNKDLILNSFFKLKNIGGTKAMIINVIKPKDSKSPPRSYTLKGEDYNYERYGIEYDFTGLTIVTVPYLYDCNGDEAIENMDAHNDINKMVRE